VRSHFKSFVSVAVISLLAACSSGPTHKEQIAAFRAGPTQAELKGYRKYGYVSAVSQQGKGLLGYLNIGVEHALNTSLTNGVYANVNIKTSPTAGNVTRSYKIPGRILGDIPEDLRVKAYLNYGNPGARDVYLQLGKEVAQRTICVGKKVSPSDKTPKKISDPESINKILAANNGRVLGASLEGLNITAKSSPVVEYPPANVPSLGITVHLKCV